MLFKRNQSFRKFDPKIFCFPIFIFIFAVETWAQANSTSSQGADYTWLYILLSVLAAVGAGAFFFRSKSQKTESEPTNKSSLKSSSSDSNNEPLDADKELEWLRKNQKLVGKKNPLKSKAAQHPSKPMNAGKVSKSPTAIKETAEAKAGGSDSSALPIFSINRLELARPFDTLAVSNDEDLMSAIEQSYDEFEEDEEVRDLALRVLTAFRTRNSIEALSQMALYDLSSALRSKAVNVLSEFNHESVFETILLANADPTREVRAAAARSLSKLTFDRADAWTRITETDEQGRIAQAARAAIESGFVDMSFDRLVSKDYKQAYEAFTLMTLLIKANETDRLFDALEKHRDMNVRRAILHVIKVAKNQKTLDGLYRLIEQNKLPEELREAVNQTIEEISFVTV